MYLKTGKCLDALPVLVYYANTGTTMILVYLLLYTNTYYYTTTILQYALIRTHGRQDDYKTTPMRPDCLAQNAQTV